MTTTKGDTISRGRASVYRIPTEEPEETDGTANWSATTLVLAELECGSTTGLGFTYSDEATGTIVKALIERHVIGAAAEDIPAIHHQLDRATRNMGRPGLVSTAISAIDICLWDLKARLFGKPLSELLGQAHEKVEAYGSGGFTSYSEGHLLEQLVGWANAGLRSVKMKIGRNPEADLRRATTVAKALEGKADLYVDANGAYERKQALAQSLRFAELGVTWFEEPVSSDDKDGLRLLVERVPAPIRIAAGEYIYVLDDAKALIEAGAVDVLQADVTRCGGVSNFLKIAALCEAHHLPLSAHTAPSIHAAVACAAQSSLNIEYFYDHARIERMLFDGFAPPKDGVLRPDLSRLGLGLEFKRADAKQFAV